VPDQSRLEIGLRAPIRHRDLEEPSPVEANGRNWRELRWRDNRCLLIPWLRFRDGDRGQACLLDTCDAMLDLKGRGGDVRE
jgi:hypothetical protein